MRVSFRCAVCSTVLEWPDDATPSTPINCQKCGTFIGTYGDLTKDSEAAAAAKLNRIIGGEDSER